MEAHYAEKLTLQSVAEHCYVSQWHLSKLLNRHAGKSFYDVLNSIRVKAAQTLLADPSLKIADIGDIVGYADTAHFARVFKRVAGMSANEYRNTLAGR
jgi:YesN/AraC family two-component response regulator